MFKNAYQSGLLSILYSCGSNPLAVWGKTVKNGYVKRVTDDELHSLVIEILAQNVVTTFITCPSNLTVLDDRNMKRRFRISNYTSGTKVRPFSCSMPIGLNPGWNQVQFNLADFTRRAYGTGYVETIRIQIHANCRLRRIYFSDRLYTDAELPQEYKLFLPSTAPPPSQPPPDHLPTKPETQTTPQPAPN
ncbi:hypothetical protein AAG570_002397 [Ranatra chinensis]|uniref:CFA20 domain-containing protein n=1 Tax=Ranatra chinensis TaxID=642074 RepID=A0ABD0Y7E1_9HEMI